MSTSDCQEAALPLNTADQQANSSCGARYKQNKGEWLAVPLRLLTKS